MTQPGNTHSRVNPGWYGWMGDFDDVAGYYPHPSGRAYYRQHNINWFLLGHQWVVPFLETDTYDVKHAILENKKRTRIWYEVYWWGDHSVWEDAERRGFGMNHIPKKVREKLRKNGIKPGGDNIVGKDWIAAATDPSVLASIKKTIAWQIDTIIKHCGPDALYGVVLSEEEPDHGVNVVLGHGGTRYYGEHRDEIIPQLIQVHNELYDFIKAHYPQLKVSPGFYPAWVRPGTLKADAIVMDLYPPPGKEEDYIKRWVEAYGEIPPEDHYIILWGYGDGDRNAELDRFQAITEGLIRRGYRNLGTFSPQMALRDRTHRMFDVDASGTYAPYRVEEHRQNIEPLWRDTVSTAKELGDHAAALPAVPDGAWASRDALKAWTARIYDYRDHALDAAYAHTRKMKELRALTVLVSLLKAEGLIPAHTQDPQPLPSSQLAKWEKIAKEYRHLPQYYQAVLPVEKALRDHTAVVAGQLTLDIDQYPQTIRKDVAAAIARIADLMNRAEVAAAEQAFYQLYDTLRAHKAEKSYRLRVVFGNRYGFPLNLQVHLTANYEDATSKEVYSDYPCQTADRKVELVLYLPRRPASIKIHTSPWSGALTVADWELSDSREVMRPTTVEEVDHLEKIEEWLNGKSDRFALLPWASRAGVRIVYRAERP